MQQTKIFIFWGKEILSFYLRSSRKAKGMQKVRRGEQKLFYRTTHNSRPALYAAPRRSGKTQLMHLIGVATSTPVLDDVRDPVTGIKKPTHLVTQDYRLISPHIRQKYNTLEMCSESTQKRPDDPFYIQVVRNTPRDVPLLHSSL